MEAAIASIEDGEPPQVWLIGRLGQSGHERWAIRTETRIHPKTDGIDGTERLLSQPAEGEAPDADQSDGVALTAVERPRREVPI